MAKLITAVGYLRMSTDRQETSPEQQRAEIEKYAAKHGYQVMRWYQDLGISGDRTDKRLQFQQMIADAADGRFKAILCWDQDRFGRFDSLESGYWIHPLRGQGVQLVTCTDGPVDWNSFAGRMLYGMKQEGKHQYLVDLSNNVTRRMNQLATTGRWVCGALPLGYALDEQKRIVLGKPEDVEFIQMLFREYLAGATTRQLCTLAKSKGYISSKGKPWSVAGITALLKKPMYAGTFTYGMRQFSKYQPRTSSGSGQFRAREEWITIPNNHPAIVTQQQFDAVQQQLKLRARHTAPTGKGQGFALSGLLVCGCCGSSMHGDSYNQTRNYTCGSYKTRPGTCQRYAVRESTVLPVVLEQLKAKLFNPATLKRVRAELERQLRRPVDDVDAVQKQIDSVDRKIAAAEQRLLDVSKDMIPRVEQQLRQLEQQRQELVASAKPKADRPSYTARDIQQSIDAAVAWFKKLEKLACIEYNPKKVQHLLQQFIEGIDLQMERTKWGNAKRKHLTTVTGGTIRFNFCLDAYILPPLCASRHTGNSQGFLYQVRWGKAA
jgi:DNA invertase Pin-like site-specific DNA recombinase